MSMFPHTVTLYNVEHERDPATIEEKPINYITVLEGVLFDASKASNVRTSGLVGADAVNLYIPFDVKATDGITGEKKTYIPPTEFWRLEDNEEKAKHWTLADGDNCFFIKGKVIEPDKELDFIEGAYDDVYTVNKVDEKDFGNLQHWEVGGA